jgi:hypothetical protein
VDDTDHLLRLTRAGYGAAELYSGDDLSALILLRCWVGDVLDVVLVEAQDKATVYRASGLSLFPSYDVPDDAVLWRQTLSIEDAVEAAINLPCPPDWVRLTLPGPGAKALPDNAARTAGWKP